MSSQLNYYIPSSFLLPQSMSQPCLFPTSSSFQPIFRAFKPRCKPQILQIRCPHLQKSEKIRFRKKKFKVQKKIQKIHKKKNSESKINPCFSPHNTTQFIINSYETQEIRFEGFGTESFGSMMGLVKNDSFQEREHEKQEVLFESRSEIEEMVQMAKIEQDPFRLFILINRLANMVKEKDEQIYALEKRICEQQSSFISH